jgi:hypothetical protein
MNPQCLNHLLHYVPSLNYVSNWKIKIASNWICYEWRICINAREDSSGLGDLRKSKKNLIRSSTFQAWILNPGPSSPKAWRPSFIREIMSVNSNTIVL